MIIVKIRHMDNKQEYLFRSPIHLTAGTFVLVETNRGKQFGIVSADSIETTEELFSYVVEPYAPNITPKKLRRVLGRCLFIEEFSQQ